MFHRIKSRNGSQASHSNSARNSQNLKNIVGNAFNKKTNLPMKSTKSVLKNF